MSIVSQVILKADDELRYPSSGELEGIKSFLTTGEKKVSAFYRNVNKSAFFLVSIHKYMYLESLNSYFFFSVIGTIFLLIFIKLVYKYYYIDFP